MQTSDQLFLKRVGAFLACTTCYSLFTLAGCASANAMSAEIIYFTLLGVGIAGSILLWFLSKPLKREVTVNTTLRLCAKCLTYQVFFALLGGFIAVLFSTASSAGGFVAFFVLLSGFLLSASLPLVTYLRPKSVQSLCSGNM